MRYDFNADFIRYCGSTVLFVKVWTEHCWLKLLVGISDCVKYEIFQEKTTLNNGAVPLYGIRYLNTTNEIYIYRQINLNRYKYPRVYNYRGLAYTWE